MSWRLSVALLIAIAVTPAQVAADAPRVPVEVEVPAGWGELDGLSTKLSVALVQNPPLGQVPANSGARAHVRAGQGALYVTWIEADEPVPDPEPLVRDALDALRAAPQSASPQAGSISELSYSERQVDGMVEARLEWSHLSNEINTLSRTMVWVLRPGHVNLARAECVFASDVAAEVRPVCEAALATLRVSVAEGARLPLGELAASQPPQTSAERLVLAETGDSGAGGAAGRDPLSDGNSHLRPPTGQQGQVLYQEPVSDRKPGGTLVWVIIGGVLIAFGFLLRDRSRASDGESDADSEEEGNK